MVTPPRKFDSKSPWKMRKLKEDPASHWGEPFSLKSVGKTAPNLSHSINQHAGVSTYLVNVTNDTEPFPLSDDPKPCKTTGGEIFVDFTFCRPTFCWQQNEKGPSLKKGRTKIGFKNCFGVGVLLFEPYYTYMFLLVNMIGSLFSLKNGFKTYILFDEYEWAKVGLKHWMLYFRDFCPFLCGGPCPWENHKQDNTNSCNSLIIVHTWVVCDLYCA